MKDLPAENQGNLAQSTMNLPIAWVERLFERLATMYGKQFLDQWANLDFEQVKRAWSEDLAGLTAIEIKRGLEQCKTKQWPPSLPEFINLCRPPITYEQQFFFAVEQQRLRAMNNDTWPSAALFWAACKLGYELRSQPYSAIKTRWVVMLDKCILDVASGALPNEIPKPAEALPAPGQTITAETVKTEIDKVKIILGKSLSRAWVTRILENPKNYPDISTQFANMAVNNLTSE